MLNTKHMHKTARLPLIVLFVIIYLLVLIKPSFTYPNYMQQARAQNYPASNCSYCHLTVSGGRGWNERGLWLIEQKKKLKADDINVAWLKRYQPSASKDASGTVKANARRTPEPAKAKNSGKTRGAGKFKTLKSVS